MLNTLARSRAQGIFFFFSSSYFGSIVILLSGTSFSNGGFGMICLRGIYSADQSRYDIVWEQYIFVAFHFDATVSFLTSTCFFRATELFSTFFCREKHYKPTGLSILGTLNDTCRVCGVVHKMLFIYS